MQITLTKSDIEMGLRALGLERGAAVEVHSSLSSLGHVEGGGSAVIGALMDVVGEEGAIVMSAYLVTPVLPLTDEEKARGITAKVRYLDENADCRSGMGVIPDTFRKLPDTCLGKGIHRVCAWGRDAALHAQGYGYLLSIDGWALLIGVGITRLSSMHQAESKVDWPAAITDSFRLPEDIRRDYPETEWYVEYREPGQPEPEPPWEKIWVEAERRGLISHGRIGQADCKLFKARAVVDIYEEALRSDPYTLFGVAKPADSPAK